MPEQPPPLTVTLNLDDNPWDDIAPQRLPHNPDGRMARILRAGLLPNGTLEGRSTVCLLVQLPDGTLVGVETTLRLWRMTSAALLATPQAEREGREP